MSRTYLSNVLIGDVEARIASSMYGYCGTLAATANKVVTMPYFDEPEEDILVSILFLLGNTVSSDMTLKIGNSSAYPVLGNAVCDSHEIITFIFNRDINTQVANWRVVGHNIAPATDLPEDVGTAAIGTSKLYARADHSHALNISPGTTPGSLSINNTEIELPGLGSAAFTDVEDYATAAQGTKADAAMPRSGGVFTGPISVQEPTSSAHAVNKGYVDTLFGSNDALTVKDVSYDSEHYKLIQQLTDNSNEDIVTFGSMVEADQDDFIPNSVLSAQFDLLYASAAETPARIPGNITTTRKFLRMVGIEQTENHSSYIVGTAPVWDVVTAADIGLENVTNHAQVSAITYNNVTGLLTYTMGDDAPVSLFTLGSNAFTSTEYLPIAGGQMTGPLTFNTNAMSLTWENDVSGYQAIIVDNDTTSDADVFIFKQEANNELNTLMSINNNGAVTANAFVGILRGNASTASALSHTTVSQQTINTQNGTLAFSGTGDPWIGQNWIGLQVGDSNLKFQFVNEEGNLLFRTYNGQDWVQWSTILTNANVTSGDANGQIKVGGTNINVTGLGALAFKDSISGADLGDFSDIYVTLNTEQRIVGRKNFNYITFLPPIATNEKHGMKFNGTTQSAELYYTEPTLLNDGYLRLLMANTNATPFEIGWLLNNEEHVVYSFTANEFVLSPVTSNSSITMRPGTDAWGTVGSATYRFGAIYAVDFYGTLNGNATTATQALQDSDGVQINTGYLKLSGGHMTGTLSTTHPINQILSDGRAIEASGLGTSPNKYYPLRWVFNTAITPHNGDIITICTPSPGHDYGIFLSLDNGTTYYPITLTHRDRLVDQYPSGSFITLIFDSSNSVYSVYPPTGADNRSQVTGGTWRVINYYDSGAPYGVRIYRQNTVNSELPLVISQLTYNQIGDSNVDSYTNNIYGYLSIDSTKVPTYNPSTGILTAPHFSGIFHGSIDTAGAFSTPTQVILTGHVTGTSNESTKGWTVDTTIADNVILNSMLRGGITKNKLETGIVKVFSQEETADILNFDTITINGLFGLRASADMPVTTGIRPPTLTAMTYLNLVAPDGTAQTQLAGLEDKWYIRGNTSNLTTTDWHRIVLEDLNNAVNHKWKISIGGVADLAVGDELNNDTVIPFSQKYATKTELQSLLGLADALVFKGILNNSLEDFPQIHRWNTVPTEGYSAGWVYKIDYDGIYAGNTCEVGDMIIAINDGPITGTGVVIPGDWIVVQANLDGAITGLGLPVTQYSFAIYNSTTGRVITETGNSLIALHNIQTTTGTRQTEGTATGLHITGKTFTQQEDLISNVTNRLSYGDSGAQIRFTDNQLLADNSGTLTNGAIIYSGFSSVQGTNATFHFVTENRQTLLRSDALLLHTKALIGDGTASVVALTVNGQTLLNGAFNLNDGTNNLAITNENNVWQFTSTTTGNTASTYSFSNSLSVHGHIIPTTNRQFILGSDSNNDPKHWAKVYIGEFATYGSTVQPIYWYDGAPLPVEYTPYRIHYAYVNDSNNVQYGFAGHYIDATRLSVGSTSAPEQGYTLLVNGSATIKGALQLNNNILPVADNVASLGSADYHWSRLYIGDSSSNPDSTYGDIYTPIYWNNGVPTPVTAQVQRKSFTFTANATQVQFIDQPAYTADTMVIELAVTNGKENLRAPITWAAGEHTLTLTTAIATTGVVEGYVITTRGINLG